MFSRVRATVALASLGVIAGCAQDVSCGCPVPASGPYLAVTPASIAFTSATSAPSTLAIRYGGPPGSTVGETDDCGTSARIVSVGPILANVVGSANVSVTPVAAGTCTLTFRIEKRTQTVAISVE